MYILIADCTYLIRVAPIFINPLPLIVSTKIHFSCEKYIHWCSSTAWGKCAWWEVYINLAVSTTVSWLLILSFEMSILIIVDY